MKATSINHVSVNANNLDESVAFYCDVLGMEPVATPNFAFPVQWLRLGDQQFHLFVRQSASAPQFHHLGVNVSDFGAVYRQARELGIQDRSAFFSNMYELPDGSVQMYLRDPAGNLIEVDWPDARTLDAALRAELVKLSDSVAQEGSALHATLYLRPQPTDGTGGTTSTYGGGS
jgi:lactoylglutathione lyase